MNKKTILLIGLAALLIFLLPTTLSLFAGQHTWYNAETLTERCNKCHQAIADELKASPYHNWPTDACGRCHSTVANSTKTGANFTKQGNHVAITVTCVSCHSSVGTYDPSKFNTTMGQWTTTDRKTGAIIPIQYGSLMNPQEAHKGFYEQSMSTKLEYYDNGTVKPNFGVENVTNTKGGNAACLACHTHTVFKNTWKPRVGMEIEVTYDDNGVAVITYKPMNETVTIASDPYVEPVI